MKNILPKQLLFRFWNNEFISDIVDWKYEVKIVLTKDVICDSILVEYEWSVIDIIKQDIKLKDGDTLHFEYEINVKLL
jgi:hypothetical protein